jgi:signal transduction histidine kinase
MKLYYRVGILVSLIVFSFLALYLPYVEVRSKSYDKLREKQLLLTRQASAGIEEFFINFRNMLQQYAQLPEIINFDKKGEEIAEIIHKFNFQQIRAVTRYDENGNIIFTYPDTGLYVGQNISNQAHVKKILREHRSNLSDVFFSVQGYPAVALSVPVYDRDTFKGVFAVLIDFAYVSAKYLKPIKIGENGYAWMISRNGAVVFSPYSQDVGKNIDELLADYPEALNFAERMAKGESGSGTYRYVLSENKNMSVIKLGVYMPVNILDNYWSLAVVAPQSEAYSDLNGFYEKMIFIMFVVFFVAAIYAYILQRFTRLETMNDLLEVRVAEEIEKRKEQEKLVLQQAKFAAMGEMISAIAHQWRQPLTAIGLYVQDLGEAAKEKEFSDEAVDDQVTSIMEIVLHMSDTIDDFRNFFRPDEGLADMDLRRIILDVYKILFVQLQSAGIRLSVVCSGSKEKYEISSEAELWAEDREKFTVRGYPGEMKQVILNLIQNARDAVGDRILKKEIPIGFVNVYLSNSEFEVLIEVEDNGGGVRPEALDKVFDPYFTTKGESVGLGIGLFMSKTIIEEHMGGLLMVKNIKDGAKFTISLNK